MLELALALRVTFTGGASSFKPSTGSAVASNAFTVLGPSQSVMDRGGGGICADAAKPPPSTGDVIVMPFSITDHGGAPFACAHADGLEVRTLHVEARPVFLQTAGGCPDG